MVEMLICSNVEAAVVPGDKAHLHDTLGQCWSEDAATPAAGMGARGTAPRAPLWCDACTEIPHQVQARSLYCQAHRLRLPNSSSVLLCVPQKNGNRNFGALVARLWTGNVPTNPQLAKIEMAPFDNTTVTDTNEVLLVARDPRSRLLSFYLHQIYPGSARASYCRHSPSCQDHARKIGFDPNEPPRFAQFVELVARRAKQRGGDTCFVEHHLCSQVSGCLFGVRVRSTTVLKLEEMPLWYAFVGIVEEYTASVCLWHERFGGSIVSSEEVAIKLSSSSHPPYDTSPASMGGFVDRADEQTYNAGVLRFHLELSKTHKCGQVAQRRSLRSLAQSEVAHAGLLHICSPFWISVLGTRTLCRVILRSGSEIHRRSDGRNFGGKIG